MDDGTIACSAVKVDGTTHGGWVHQCGFSYDFSVTVKIKLQLF